MFSSYLWTAVFVVIYGVVSWIVVDLLHLSGTMEMIVRTVLLGLGASLYGVGHWWRIRRERRRAMAAGKLQDSASVEQEVDFLVREAQNRLSQSPLGADAKPGTLPVFFLVGEAGAAKTSNFVNSGVEPDLLAGQVYQDNLVAPTRAANLWLGRNAMFVEAGGKLVSSPVDWVHLIKKLKPKTGWFSKKESAPRAAVVCVDGESFLKAGAEESLTAAARNIHARLGELAQTLGMNVPVYVLFTKLDRMGYFGEFVSNLSDEESTQVVGATLPIQQGIAAGVYAEEESRRLTAAFNELFYSLCDKRLPLLAREHDPAKQPSVYEFPREFRKMRGLLVRFLVDLGRPSQLRANPFLRGFYFSGVRPKTIKEAAPVSRSEAELSPLGRTTDDPLGLDKGAAQAQPVASVRTRRIPQWVFLGHLFNDVILRDRIAMGASTRLQAQAARRALWIGGIALASLWAALLTVSYFRNRSLENDVIEAARGIAQSESGGGAQELPSRSALERLDTLRGAVELLSRYEREGPPLSLRWGLYVGSDLYTPSRRLYFSRFHRLMFGQTQASLLEWMRRLPDRPSPSDQYRPTYDTLKGYLITTRNPDKSTRDFLPPLLLERWAAGRQVDPERMALARRQFEFYSDELLVANPFPSQGDGEAIERARYFLSQFNAVESIYQFMLAEANRRRPSLNFNKQFPGSKDFVVNDKDVAGAFTAEGWKWMQDAIRNVRKFFGGEKWVLGDKAYANLDPGQVEPMLRERYSKDFLANWRQFLINTEVVRYRSLQHAAQNLAQLSGNQSYLLAAFCLASTHTSVAADDVKAPYQPVHFVEPSPCSDRYVQTNNTPYMTALASLYASMDRVAKATGAPPEDLVNQTLNEATNGYRVTRQIAQGFRIDRDGNVHALTQKLMEDPIKYAEAILGRLGPAQLNTAGRGFCQEFAALTNKYPFNTASKVDATLQELNAVFRPGDGRINQFYETSLKNYLDRSGAGYIRKPDNKVQITEAFLRFFNRAIAFRDAIYKGGTTEPKLAYTMKTLPSEGLKTVTLSLDGQTLRGTAKGGESRDFTWPGAANQSALLAGSLGGGDLEFIRYDGLWSAFRFFGDADQFTESGGLYTLQWVPRQGLSAQPIRISGGKTLTLPFQLDLKGAPPIFKKGYLSGFQCVSEVAR